MLTLTETQKEYASFAMYLMSILGLIIIVVRYFQCIYDKNRFKCEDSIFKDPVFITGFIFILIPVIYIIMILPSLFCG